ncbi:MAG: histidine--tRNA ligase [Deltaproteobacteria bacterium]|nr:histidine--tRNA ligase [Deltaproteobacteria bacterium]
MDTQPVKGTRDFYPEDMRLRNWLFGIWRSTARTYGFEEFDACVLESEELYIRKAGDEITGQLYHFEDKGGRRLALRPELTPSLARMVMARQKALSFPIKWTSIPQCFRYERMTRGRKREHYQWNMDVVGQPLNAAEIELISALLTAIRAMGLDHSHVRLHLNDRRLLESILSSLNVPEDRRQGVLVVMDKRDKISPEHLESMLAEQGLTGVQLGHLNEFLGMTSLEQVKARLAQNGGTAQGVKELEDLMGLLGRMGLGTFLTFDITVVRGLSYYTGTVFELKDARGQLRTLAGGGRYDSLLAHLGGDPVPAVGFGFGDVVILELLEDLGLVPKLNPAMDFVVIPFSETEIHQGLEIAQALREQGLSVDMDASLRRLKKALQRAEETHAQRAVLLMPDELAKGEVVVRVMATREEQRVNLKKFLASPRD